MSDIIQAIPAKTEGMSTGVKILLTSALILVIAGAVYFGTKPPKNKDTQSGSKGNSNTASDGLTYSPSGSASAGNSSGGATTGFPLNVGSTGPLVKDIQNGLNKSINAGLAVDGIFGPLTLAAVKKAKFTVPIQQDEYTSIKAGQTGDKILNAISSLKNIFADGSGVSTYSRSPLTYPPVTGIMKEYGIKLRNDINV